MPKKIKKRTTIKKPISRALTSAATKRNRHTGETTRQKETRIAKAFSIANGAQGLTRPTHTQIDVRETVMSRKKFKRALDKISPEAMAVAVKVDRAIAAKMNDTLKKRIKRTLIPIAKPSKLRGKTKHVAMLDDHTFVNRCIKNECVPPGHCNCAGCIQDRWIEDDGAQGLTRPTLPDKFHAAGRGLPLFEKLEFSTKTKPQRKGAKAQRKNRSRK